MTGKGDVYRFMLPEILGEPDGVTNSEGTMLFPAGRDLPPPSSFIFFIPIKEWNDLVEKKVNK